jgi:hypothetical protein
VQSAAIIGDVRRCPATVRLRLTSEGHRFDILPHQATPPWWSSERIVRAGIGVGRLERLKSWRLWVAVGQWSPER